MARDGVLAAAGGIAASVAPGVTRHVDDVLQSGARGARETLQRPTAEAVTPEGVRVPVSRGTNNDDVLHSPLESRSSRRTSGGGAAYEADALPRIAAQYPRGFRADEVMQRQGVRNQPAADYVGYKPVRGGYVAEITVANKSPEELGRQFEGARSLVTDMFGEAPVDYNYVVHTTNRQLRDALAARGNTIPISQGRRRVERPVTVIYEGR